MSRYISWNLSFIFWLFFQNYNTNNTFQTKFPKPLTLLANSNKNHKSFICSPRETMFRSSHKPRLKDDWAFMKHHIRTMNKWKQNEFLEKQSQAILSAWASLLGSVKPEDFIYITGNAKDPPVCLNQPCQDSTSTYVRPIPRPGGDFPLIWGCWANTIHRHAGRKRSFVLKEREPGGKHIPELLSDMEWLPYQDSVVKNSVHFGSGSRVVFDVKSFAPLLCPACKCFPPKPKNCLNSIQSPVSTFGLQPAPVNWIHGMLCLLIILLLPVKQGFQETTQKS